MYDLAIIGNGAIASMAALKIKEEIPKSKICIIGNRERNYSASKAAGAMIVSFSEIEESPKNDIHEKFLLEYGEKSKILWKKFLVKNKINHLLTAKDTIVFLKKNSNKVEKKNFSLVYKVSKNYNKSYLLSKENIKKLFKDTSKNIAKSFVIKDEFGICSKGLFDFFDEKIKKLKIDLIHANAHKIETKKKSIIIKFKTKNKINTKKILIAAGINSSKLLGSKFNVLQMYQSVGTALEVELDGNLNHLTNKYVIRSVNRGGANCGIHTVPRSSKNLLYIGAGSYISKLTDKNPKHRLETINYLYNSFKKEIGGTQASHYSKLSKIFIGARPRSIDKKPLIGTLKKNKKIFIASATDRVGLTWSSALSLDIFNWFYKNKINEELNMYQPDRKIISWGNKEKSISKYYEMKYANLQEHGIINKGNKKNIKNFLKKIAIKKFKIVHRIIEKDKVLDPASWDVLS